MVGKLKILEISDLIMDSEIYPRFEIENNRVKDYSESMNSGALFPPITVAHYRGKYIVIDGWHRVKAYQRNKILRLQAEIIPFETEREMFVEAVKRNITHGKSFTRKEKVDIACRLKNMSISTIKISEMVCITEQRIRLWTVAKTKKLAKPISNRNLHYKPIDKRNQLIEKKIDSFLALLIRIFNSDFNLNKENEESLVKIRDFINKLVEPTVTNFGSPNTNDILPSD